VNSVVCFPAGLLVQPATTFKTTTMMGISLFSSGGKHGNQLSWEEEQAIGL